MLLLITVISFTVRYLKVNVCVQLLSYVQLFAAPWTVAHKAPLSMEFSRQEYWSRVPFYPPRDPPDPRIKHASLISPIHQMKKKKKAQKYYLITILMF